MGMQITPVNRIASASPALPCGLGFGGAPIGDIFEEIPESDALGALRAAWKGGVRYFDTAPWYGHGLSEHRLGTILRAVDRAEVFVSTKVGRFYRPAQRGQDVRIKWAGGLNFALEFDYTATGFEKSLEQSQMRLGTPTIDALVIHDLDRGYHGSSFDHYFSQLLGSGLDYLKSLRKSGELCAIGMGINTLEDFTFMVGKVDVDFFLVAMPYTLLDQDSVSGPMAECVHRGIKVVVGAPYASGILADPEHPKLLYNYQPVPGRIRARALSLREIAHAHGVPLAAAALQFPLFHPAVQSVIPGANNAKQSELNCKYFNLDIPPELWRDMKSAGLISPATPTPD